jgi:uncharacterized ion transporter superfamily protein YfcC
MGGTLFGMQEDALGFFIILVPFFVIAGFDTMTALLIILLGTTTGFAFSIVNPFSAGMAFDMSNVMIGVDGNTLAGTFVGYYESNVVMMLDQA